MGTGFFRTRRQAGVLTAVFAMIFAFSMRGGGAYLKQIGPSALRFSDTSAQSSSFALPSLLSEPVPDEKMVATKPPPANQTNTTKTNIPTLAIASPPAATNNVAETTAFTIPTETNSDNTVATVSPARDLLVVSPQMLTEYFK